ncbi:MAG: alpha/beta hydrolase [Alicyclobacillus sp.]|nr:alpha/beta hydrolase [Alicyclobacillus sp.]
MPTVHDLWIEVAGHRIHVLHSNPKPGTPVVFLHGAGGGGQWFSGLERLAQTYTVYYPEHPGFGLSDLPDWLETVSDLALFYWDIFDHLGIDRVHLIGSSLGGWLAAELSVLQPQRVQKLVLSDAAGVRAPVPEAPDFFMIPSDDLPRWLFAHPERVPPQPPLDPAVLVKNRTTAARFAWSPRFYNPKLRHWLYRISAPTLLVWGQEDRLFPPAMAEPYQTGIPHCRTVWIEDAGHLPYLEQSDRFFTLVEQHLADDTPVPAREGERA